MLKNNVRVSSSFIPEPTRIPYGQPCIRNQAGTKSSKMKYIVMFWLVKVIGFEKVLLGIFFLVDITYTNLDGVAYSTASPCGTAIAPRLQPCTSCCCTEYCRQL